MNRRLAGLILSALVVLGIALLVLNADARFRYWIGNVALIATFASGWVLGGRLMEPHDTPDQKKIWHHRFWSFAPYYFVSPVVFALSRIGVDPYNALVALGGACFVYLLFGLVVNVNTPKE